ncbi:MAG: cation:proton antiporter [Ruminococcus sp.]|nr:cation:proton antiporter [Ruminococcus sp.]
MLLSLALISIFGLVFGTLFKKIHLPPLLGMLLAGILLGPYALNLLDSSILDISADLRRIALIIILTRAGLSLNIKDLLKNGRCAVFMCFVPACFEITGMLILAPRLLGLSLIESAVLGTVIAAVSPAVVVPKMLNLIEKGYGTNKGIPQMIMAGASIDDVFVIVLFTVFSGLAKNGEISALTFIRIPTSIILGLLGGLLAGLLLSFLFKTFHIRDSAKVIIILSSAFILDAVENAFTGFIGFSGLLAVMASGIVIGRKRPEATKRLSVKFSKLWICAEIMLFVLVGASVNIGYALKAGVSAIILILGVSIFRMSGVFVSTLKTDLNLKERLFTMFAYIPKATVQAAIGALPLSMGLACGETVLTVAVLAIIITAPLGAFLVDITHKRFLQKTTVQE